MLDNILLQSGIPFDTQKATERSYQIIEKVLDTALNTDSTAQRKLKEPAQQQEDNDDESVLSKTSWGLKKDASKKIIKEHRVTDKDF